MLTIPMMSSCKLEIYQHQQEAGAEDADQMTIPMMSSCILEINQHQQEAGGEDANHPHDVLLHIRDKSASTGGRW